MPLDLLQRPKKKKKPWIKHNKKTEQFGLRSKDPIIKIFLLLMNQMFTSAYGFI